MSSLSPTAAPAEARPLPEHLEGDTILLQDIQTHLEALRRHLLHVRPGMLQQVMATEVGCVTALLRGFTGVQAETSDHVLTSAERALAEVRAYAVRQEYAEATGYARSALERPRRGPRRRRGSPPFLIALMSRPRPSGGETGPSYARSAMSAKRPSAAAKGESPARGTEGSHVQESSDFEESG